MTYEERGDHIRLEMTEQEFHRLIYMMGLAAGYASRRGDADQFREFVAFANDLNARNPNWTQYRLDEFLKHFQ